VQKKKGLEQRFFTLYDDHLAYYRSEEEFQNGEEHRGRVGLEDMTAVRVQEDGFALVLGEQELKVVVNDEEIRKAWVKQLQKVIPDKVKEEGEESEEEEEEENNEGDEEVEAEEEVEPESKKPSEATKPHEAKTHAVEAKKKAEEEEAKKPDKGTKKLEEEEKEETRSSNSEGATIKVKLVRNGVSEAASLELDKTVLIVHGSNEDVPLKVAIADVQRLDQFEGGFDLSVRGLEYQLKFEANTADLDLWLKRLQKAQMQCKASADPDMDRASESDYTEEEEEAEVEGYGISELELEPDWVDPYMKTNIRDWKKKTKGFFASSWTCKACGTTQKSKLPAHMHYQDKKNKQVKIDLCELCFSRYLPPPPGSPQTLCTGLFYIKDGKKKTHQSFLALTPEGIVQYKAMSDYIEGKRPVAWRPLEGTTELTVTDEGIITHIVEGKLDWKMQVGYLFAAETRLKVALLFGRKLQALVAQNQKNVSVRWSPSMASKLPSVRTTRKARETGRRATESVTPRSHTARHTGPVSIEGEEVEHALLRKDKFLVFESKAAEVKGASARTAVPMEEVTGVRTWDDGFQFEMQDGSTMKVFVAPDTHDEWVEALKDVTTVFEDEIPAPMTCTRFTEEIPEAAAIEDSEEIPTSRRHSLSGGGELSSKATKEELEQMEQEEQPEDDSPLLEGPLIFIGDEDPTDCYALLSRAQLHIASAQGEEVESTLEVQEISDVAVEEDLFALTFIDGNTYGFRVPKTSPVTLDDWCEVLLVVCGDVLEGEGRDRVMTGLTYRGTSLETVPYDEKKLREVYDLCQDDDIDEVTKDSLFNSCRARTLVAGFFGIEEDQERGTDVEQGLELMEVILEALQIGRAASGGCISWPEFKTFHARWEARQKAVRGSERLITQLRRWSDAAPRWQGMQPTKTRFIRNARINELTVPPKHRKEPNVAKRKTLFSQRALITKKGFNFNTHKDMHEAYSLLHGSSKLYQLQRPVKTAVDPKINIPSTSLQRRRGSALVAPKITSSARIPNCQSSLEEVPWQKITHAGHDQGPRKPGRCGRGSVTRKVNETPGRKEIPKRCSSLPAGGIKIGERSRDPLARERGRRRDCSPKVTDRGPAAASRAEAIKLFHAGSVHKMQPFGC